MASKKITITLEESLVDAVRELAEGNVSAYVARLIRNAKLRAELQEAAEAGSLPWMPPAYYEDVERDAAERYAS